jgi:hypothetical protein
MRALETSRVCVARTAPCVFGGGPSSQRTETEGGKGKETATYPNHAGGDGAASLGPSVGDEAEDEDGGDGHQPAHKS